MRTGTGQRNPQRQNAEFGWDAERERRLIEMVREQRTLEEIAREVSVPPDMLIQRMSELRLFDEDERPW